MVQETGLCYAEVNSPLFEPGTIHNLLWKTRASSANLRLLVAFLAHFFTALIFWFFCIKAKEQVIDIATENINNAAIGNFYSPFTLYSHSLQGT